MMMMMIDAVGAQLRERGQREQDDSYFRDISKSTAITNTNVHAATKLWVPRT
jgi:hypothetical protein